jgi:outer membrane receptor for ferrienterochelin and colicins
MVIRFFIILFAFSTLSAGAQTRLEVVDNEKNGLPNAHITYSSIDKKFSNTILSDLDGIAIIPASFTSKNNRFLLSITYVGFVSIDSDTVNVKESIRIKMKEDLVSLDQVVVTGQYSPNDPDKAVHKISIISSEKIEAMAAVNLTDVLVNELNMNISQDNILGSQVSLQGLGEENVKILIDGVPMIGRSAGNIDLNQINMENIERIEVVEGPMSVNYGTNALAGAINLITKKGSAQKWNAGVHAYTESVGKYNLTGNINFSEGPHSVGVSGGRNYFDGWNPGDEAWSNNDPIADSTRFQQWKPKMQYLANFQYAYQLKDWNIRYKGDYFNEKITNRGYPNYYQFAFDDYYYTNRLDNSLFVDGSFSKNFKGNFIGAYNIFNRRKNTYISDLTTLSQTVPEDPGLQDTTQFNQGTFRGSVANVNPTKNINYEVGYDINLEEGYGKRIEDGRQTQNDYALFASAEYRPWVNTVFRPGLRIAYNSNFQSPIIPSINVKQDIGKVALRASYALGFRAPSLKEQYLYFFDTNHQIKGNPDLKPENSDNFSLSAKYTTLHNNALYKIELAGFYNYVENLIDLLNVNGSELYTYINVDIYKTMGLSGNFRVDVSSFKLSVGGSYIGRYNQFQNDEINQEFTWTPEVQFNIGYVFQEIGLTAALFLKYQGMLPTFQPDENDFIEQVYVDDYTWADFTLTQLFWKKQINLSAGVKNLFNVESVQSGVNTGGTHTVSGARPVGMGRSYFVSLRYNFKSKN